MRIHIREVITSVSKCVSNHKWLQFALLTTALLLLLWFALRCVTPKNIFASPYSTTLYSAEGELLGARIASDGQWRFPASEGVSEKFAICITTYEDKRFYWHQGIDILAIGRAMRDNLRAKSIVSGGSTLTMQLSRIARGNRERTVTQKLIEMLWSVSIESRFSKDEILNLYASHAPFGGNVVGIEAASWRYYGRSLDKLSWAESATLAVLPNSPAMIHPGRNRETLLRKRNALLKELQEQGHFDLFDYELYTEEPLPDEPIPLPNNAAHLLETLAKTRRGERIETSVNSPLQIYTQRVVDEYVREFKSNHINNAAVLIADTESGEILAYIGNVSFEGEARHGNNVDVVPALRSTGSILKPFLYAGLLTDGAILPKTLIADTPLNINGYTPMNHNKIFHGAVHADQALLRSLNVPLVRMLSGYNTGRFMQLLKGYGMRSLVRSEGFYGASLVLGGADGSLLDITGMYASMGRVMMHYGKHNGRYNPADIHPLTPYKVTTEEKPIVSPNDKRLRNNSLLSASSIWFTFEALTKVNRPEEETDWHHFSSMKKVAWKTGTSYGGRDAWAVGLTPKYTIGVWVGNASGEGRAGLMGVGNAAPIMFELFSKMSDGGWFEAPLDDFERALVCPQSGYKGSEICTDADTIYIPRSGLNAPPCPFHRVIHLSKDEKYRVNSSCEEVANIVTRSWFQLPPAQEYYYVVHNANYRTMPPYRRGCVNDESGKIGIIYPEHNSTLFLPRGFAEAEQMFIFRAAHSESETSIYWYIDEQYMGVTKRDHSIACRVGEGEHLLTLTDSDGNQRIIAFNVKK